MGTFLSSTRAQDPPCRGNAWKYTVSHRFVVFIICFKLSNTGLVSCKSLPLSFVRNLTTTFPFQPTEERSLLKTKKKKKKRMCGSAVMF